MEIRESLKCKAVDGTSFHVLNILKEWSRQGRDAQWKRYTGLQDAMREKGFDIPIKNLRQAMRELMDARLVTYECTYNGDGQINGRGYFYRE